MVTKAVQNCINAHIGGDRTPSKMMPLANTVLGGIMLFDGRLTEDVNNIYLPGADAHLVGYAMQNTDISNPIRGSYNSIESGRTSTGYTSVWDFSTSQGNGTIRSLARTLNTSDSGSTFGLLQMKYNIDYFHSPAYSNYVPILYKPETQEVVYMSYDSDGKIRLNTVYKPFSEYQVGDSVNTHIYKNSITLDFKNPPSGFLSTSYRFWHNGYDGYAYLTYTQKNTTGNGVVKYRRINLETLELDDTEYSITCNNCQFDGYEGSTMSYNSPYAYCYSAINNGKIYVVSADKSKIYIIDLKNPTVITSVACPVGYSIQSQTINFSPLPNGGMRITLCTGNTGQYQYYAIIYPDAKIVVDSSAGGRVSYSAIQNFGLLADGMVLAEGIQGSNAYNYLATGFLGTICNLDSGVIKTAETSMKITYTLTDVQ